MSFPYKIISVCLSLNFGPKGPIDNKSSLFQIMDWSRFNENPFPEAMLTKTSDAIWRH